MHFRDTDRTCVIFASGPTAGLCDTSLLPGWPVLAVNDGIYLYGAADALYASDAKWWSLHIEQVRRVAPDCALWTQDKKTADERGLNYIELERRGGLSLTPGKIRGGGTIGNSGAQAINLAVLWGARRLILVGFDMKRIDGRSHYFGEHPAGLSVSGGWDNFVKQMGELARELYEAGIKVANTSRDTALPYFEYLPLVKALDAARVSAN